jgi:O-antigen/teichoic acid export membrane protein
MVNENVQNGSGPSVLCDQPVTSHNIAELATNGQALTDQGIRTTEDAGAHHVARRATRGGIALLIRQVVVYAVNIGGGILLARLLTPSQFGFYGVVVFALLFLNIFGGTGFAANLIRLPQTPTVQEQRAVFTAQECLVACLFVAVWIAAPYLTTAYHVPGQGRLFFRLIDLSLLLTSLMVMPQIQLERDLAFDKLAIIEVGQAIIFNAGVVLMAWRGLGILSFSIALAARAGLGAILAMLISPWKIGFRWDFQLIRTHANFGIALQGSSLISSIKDAISPVFVGMYLGMAYVGYVTWANTLATYSVVALMPLQRLYLPFFARLQHDRRQLARYVSHTLWFTNAIAAPLTLITVALAHPVTTLVFGSKWLYSLPLFYYLVAGNLFVACSTPMLGVLNALGRAHTTLLVSSMWMVSTWVIGVPLTLAWGLHGFGIAMICVSLTNLVLYWIVWRELGVNPAKAYWPAWPLAAGLSCLLYLIQLHWIPSNIMELAAYAVVTLVVYGAGLWTSSPSQVAVVRRMLRGTPSAQPLIAAQ